MRIHTSVPSRYILNELTKCISINYYYLAEVKCNSFIIYFIQKVSLLKY